MKAYRLIPLYTPVKSCWAIIPLDNIIPSRENRDDADQEDGQVHHPFHGAESNPAQVRALLALLCILLSPSNITFPNFLFFSH
jgi:hypothetical protein